MAQHCPCGLYQEQIESGCIRFFCQAPRVDNEQEICGRALGAHPRRPNPPPPAPAPPAVFTSVSPVFKIRLEVPFSPLVLRKSRSPRGSIHGSTIVTGGDEDEKETLRHWFHQALACPTHFELPKPEEDERQATSSTEFIDYRSAIEDLPLGLKVWDIQRSGGDTTKILLEDSNGLQKELTGRADFIISSNSALCQGAALQYAQCVVEIQSKPSEIDCEYQMLTYLILLMNHYGFLRLTGILVYDNGTCRAYRASREGGNALYEQNDTFPLYQIADILPTLLHY